MKSNRSCGPRPASLVAVALLLLGGLGLSACGRGQHSFLGTEYDPRPPAPAVELTDFNNQPFRLRDYFGQPIVVFFGYTNCPDVCPATVYNVAWVFDRLQSVENLSAKFVMITVDPSRDDSQALKQFLGGFDSSFIGLTGTPEELESVQSKFGILAQRDDGVDLHAAEHVQAGAENYTITHTSRLFLIDKRGNLAVSYSFGTEPEVILTDLLYLIHER